MSIDISETILDTSGIRYGKRLVIDVNKSYIGTEAGTLTLSEQNGRGTYGDANSGTLLLEHEHPGGYSSIVFKSSESTTDYGFIRYIDDYETRSELKNDKLKDIFGEIGRNNSVLFLGAESDYSENSRDNVLIRPSGSLVLDSSNGDISGGGVHILPNGGDCIIYGDVDMKGADCIIRGNLEIVGVLTANIDTTSLNSAVAFAETAGKFSTTKLIGGVDFDGSADIDLPGVNIEGNQDTTGNAATASKLLGNVHDVSDISRIELSTTTGETYNTYKADQHVFQSHNILTESTNVTISGDVYAQTLTLTESGADTFAIGLGNSGTGIRRPANGRIEFVTNDNTYLELNNGSTYKATIGSTGNSAKLMGDVFDTTNTARFQPINDKTSKYRADTHNFRNFADNANGAIQCASANITGNANVDGFVLGKDELQLGTYNGDGNHDKSRVHIYPSTHGSFAKQNVHRADLHIFNDWDNNSELMRVDVANREVGIGTTNPKQLLDVYGGNLRVFKDISESHIFLGEESATNKSGMIKYYQGTGTGDGTVPGKMIFGHYGDYSGGDRGICVKNGGFVGINTDNPTEALDVNGNANITGTLSCDGNAKIGNVITDSHTLNGNANITGTLSCNGNATIGNATTDSHTFNGNAKITNNVDISGDIRVDGLILSKTNLKLGNYSTNVDEDKRMIEIYASDTGVDASGRANPTKLIVYRADYHAFKTWNDKKDLLVIDPKGNVYFASNFMRVDVSNSQVGIGTTNPTQLLDLSGGNLRVFEDLSHSHIFLGEETGETSHKSGMIKYYQDNGYDSSGTMHIGHYVHIPAGVTPPINPGLYVRGNGYTGINTDNPTYTLDVTGDARFTQGIDADYFFATSDYRVKEKVQTISGDLYTVDHLRPVSYVLKHSQQPHIGFIAHELQEHFPTAVSGEKDGEKMQSVNYSELVPVLVKEVQELKRANAQLQKSNAQLQKSNAQLQQDMVELKAMVLQKQ